MSAPHRRPAPSPVVQIDTPGMITGSFDVVYNTAVPEPHGFLWFGIGALGTIVLAFRRRRANAGTFLET